MYRMVLCSLSLLALLASCDRPSTSVQNKESTHLSSTEDNQKLAQNESGEQLIIDNDIDEPTGDAIDKAEHDDEVEVDMD